MSESLLKEKMVEWLERQVTKLKRELEDCESRERRIDISCDEIPALIDTINYIRWGTCVTRDGDCS